MLQFDKIGFYFINQKHFLPLIQSSSKLLFSTSAHDNKFPWPHLYSVAAMYIFFGISQAIFVLIHIVSLLYSLFWGSRSYFPWYFVLIDVKNFKLKTSLNSAITEHAVCNQIQSWFLIESETRFDSLSTTYTARYFRGRQINFF